jgi:hypothetical protein
MPDIGIITPNPSAQRVTAASMRRRQKSKGPMFDPIAGELHHDGKVVFLSRTRTDLLLLLIKAKGEMVPLEAVEALSKGFAQYTEAANRRRALVH